MRSGAGIRRAAMAVLTVIATPAFGDPSTCHEWHYVDRLPRQMQDYDRTLNRDAQGKPLIPAFAEVVPLLLAQRWRDALPLLDRTAKARLPPLGEHQWDWIEFKIIFQSGWLAQGIRQCPLWMPIDQSHTPGPPMARWDSLPKLPSANANVIRP
jgi:hypothetical protein